MKKVLLCGYFGFDNVGDELILETIIEYLKNLSVEVCILSARPDETANTYGVSAVNRWNIFTIINEIIKCDLLIFSGGLFQDKTSSLSLYYYLGIIILAKIFRRKVYLYAAGFEPIKHTFNKYILKYVFNKVDKIGARTTSSYKFLVDLGVNISSVDLTADAVLCKAIMNKPNRGKMNTVGVVLCSPKNDYFEQVQLFSQLCELIYSQLKVNIALIPFHLPYDMYFAMDILTSLQTSFVKICLWSNIKDIYDIFSLLGFTISQRLHGLILATLYKLPMIGIFTDTKIEAFLDDIGEKHMLFYRVDTEAIINVISEVMSEQQKLRNYYVTILPELYLRSQRDIKNVISLL